MYMPKPINVVWISVNFQKNPPLQFSRLQAYNLRGLSSKWTEPNLTELNATRRHLHVAWWVPDPPIESETSFRRQVWSLENFTWLPFIYRFKLGSVCCRYGRPSWQLLFFFLLIDLLIGLCTNSVRIACPAQAWVVRRLTAWYLPRMQSPSQNSRMHPTPGGDSPTLTTDRRSLLLFVAAFALVSVLQI